MHAITRQLARVRRLGRGLLVTQRLAQAVGATVGVLILLGAVDFALRLPVMLRVVLLAAGGAVLVVWLGSRLVRAVRFVPSLTDLALRAERLFPVLRGSLASAVEFTEQAGAYADPARTAVLAEASRVRAEAVLEPGQLRTLLAPRRTLASLGLALALVAAAGIAATMAPDSARIAAARWFTPWAGVEWPKRTAIVSLTDAEAWPADTPLPLHSAIERGHFAQMRVWVHYRLIDHNAQPGRWQRVLMSEQAAPAPSPTPAAARAGVMPVSAAAAALPRYERLVELAERAPVADERGGRGQIEYYFEAGDDRTAAQQIALVERPAVTAVHVTIDPPAYARGLIEPRRTDLHARSERHPRTRGLIGSTAELRIDFNKPLRITGEDVARVLPGLADLEPEDVQFEPGDEAAHARATGQIALRFALRERVETAIELEDVHGFTNLSERRYAIEALVDEPPTASLLQPQTDQSVLPEAQVALEALVQDEIGVEQVAIVAEMPTHATDASGQAASGSEETSATVMLARDTGRQPRLSLRHTLDLSEFALRPGDTVTLIAMGQDVYELDGARHDPVRSAPRRLRIIDDATLTRQIRSELASVRQQAVRLEARQRQLTDQPPQQAQPQQRRLTQQLEAQRSLVQRLMDRAERNRLDEPALDELMDQAGDFLDDASEASAAAADQLDAGANADDPQQAEEHEQVAHQRQADVRTALNDLVSLLDQGQDAMALQLELRRLHTEQRNIEAQTADLLPQTAGSALEDLPDALRERLRELAERQEAAADQAQELVGEMRSTAEALAQADDERSEAAARALAEAANLAEREALGEQMDASAEAIDDNRLSQAGQTQADALDVMQRMLEEMTEHERRMQAMLVRRLQELAKRLEQLIERQTQQLAQLDEADAELPALAEPQIELRQATMAAADVARRGEQTASVAETIELAINAQASAVRGLREADERTARAGKREAIEQLEAALEQVRQQQEQIEREAADEQRRELQAAYHELAERQEALHQRVRELIEREQPLDRRQRAALIGLAGDQEEVRTDAAALGEDIEDSLLFDYLHERVDELAERAVSLLRQAEASEAVAAAQQRVVMDLLRMAAALDPDDADSDFAGPQANGGGEGGGEGDAGGLVPPLAELKLLRALQEAALDETRQLDQRVRGQAEGDPRARLEELSSEQNKLAELGEQLIQQLQQQMQAPVPGPDGMHEPPQPNE